MNTAKLSLLFTIAAFGSTGAMDNGYAEKMRGYASTATTNVSNGLSITSSFLARTTHFSPKMALRSCALINHAPATGMMSGLTALGITNALDKNAPRITTFLLRSMRNAIQEGATKAVRLLRPVAQHFFAPAKLKKAAPFALAGFAISALYYGMRYAYLDRQATPDESADDVQS